MKWQLQRLVAWAAITCLTFSGWAAIACIFFAPDAVFMALVVSLGLLYPCFVWLDLCERKISEQKHDTA